MKDSNKKVWVCHLWNQLEHWVDRFKKDIQDWGIGYDPIFTDGHGRWSNGGWQRAVGGGTMQQRHSFSP